MAKRRQEPIRSLLIANRGEIAVRVARACAELGIESVAAVSEADVSAMHARAADRSVLLGPAPAAASYLRAERVIALAKDAGCDAIHPGYGFLSQDPAFADAVAAAGLKFVGPPGAAMRVMGDKTSARRAMAAAGVPVVPGFEGDGDETPERLRAEADRIGYPLLVKAAAGGGGRGMRIVRGAADLQEALDAAGREATKAFGNGRLFLERYLENSHHVEIQVLCDAVGGALHLLERECSVQRRYQKLVEESPSPLLDDALRSSMGESAVAAARACGYVNAGTVEFLVAEDRSFYFLEMNTRLQVEHPVTELITGLDLVSHQIRVAEGRPLPFRQADVRSRGHAIECRVNAEDPAADFAPSAGRLAHVRFPVHPGVRVDAGYETGDEVSTHYDSLLAKVLVHAEDRAAAIARMDMVLRSTSILGVATNLGFLRGVLAHPVFRDGKATTTFVRDHMQEYRDPPGANPPLAALVALALSEGGVRGRDAAGAQGDLAAGRDPWAHADGFRLGG